MAFTLISVSRLDAAKYQVTFKDGQRAIKSPQGRMMATIPLTNGLYRLPDPVHNDNINYVNISLVKLDINQAHRKFGHIAHAAVKYAINNGKIVGIELDPNIKPEFCEACAKAKAAWQPFPKESLTRATVYGKRVHWDLWGPASVQSINRNSCTY